MENLHYSTTRPPLFTKDFKSTNLVSGEAVISRNIHSCFQMANMIVTKVKEIETRKRKVILVADDEPLTFRLIEDFFQDAKLLCEILPAATGRIAYNIAVTKMPDLIITDWLMPELNGIDLIRQLKANPETKDIPVILTTGALISNEEFSKILAAGAIDCLRKPIDDMELVAKVKTALALHDALEEIKENEESIHTKNQFLNFLMDVAPNPIFFTNNTGSVLGCNESFEKLIGTDKNDIVGNVIQEFLPLENQDGLNDFLSKVEPGVITRFEVEFSDQFRQAKNLLLTYIGLGNGSLKVIIGSITDITEIIQSNKIAMMDLEVNVERLQSELDHKHKKLAIQAELLIHSKNVKSNFIEAVSKLQPYLTNEGKSKFYSLLKQIHWELNDEMELNVLKDFDQLHAKFYHSLERNCPSITKNEKRLCAYLKINHCASDIARITNKSLNSINVAFARLRTKLQLPNSKDLRSFLLEISPPSESTVSGI